jgi:serine/threonine-protein kinase
MTELAALAPDWPEISRVLDDALAMPAGERASWLAGQTALTEPVRQAVQRLLAVQADIETGDFLGTLPPLGLGRGAESGPADGAGAAWAEPQPGAAVGPWRLLRELGQGGMGSVWLAERADGSLKRQVALKLPRLSWARGLAERMARERDILASLEHSHIARLYDAGLDEHGRPWLALEHVQGKPIDEHARDQALDVKQRVRLLLQVCEAVAYAHSRLVIHRDLKPSNILVTEDGQVKLLDFGIAKLMQGEQAQATALTELGGRALTLDYASPEQVRGEALTTSSDVYSLGVVAFELLTGARPYQLKRGSAAELEEAIAQADVPLASTAATPMLRKALRGDLDAILNKSLKKAVGDRYAGVAEVGADLLRHLGNEPVTAQADTRAYRVGKFLRRYRLQAGAAAAVAGSLLAGTGVAVDQARRADAQRDLALRANEQALLAQRDAEGQATTARAQRSIAEAATAQAEQAAVTAREQSLRAQQAVVAEQRAAADARRQAVRAEEVKRFVLSLFERADSEAGAGAATTALELLQQARTRIDRELRDEPAVAFELNVALARSLASLGDRGAAMAIVTELLAPKWAAAPVASALRLQVRIMHAEWLPDQGKESESLARLTELERDTRSGSVPPDLRVAVLRSLSQALLTGGSAYADAVKRAEEAAAFADHTPGVSAVTRLRAWMSVANARQLARQGGVREAAERALGLARQIYGEGKAEPLLEARQFFALGLVAEGRPAEALPHYQELLRARVSLLGATHNSLAGLYNSLGNAQMQTGDFPGALDSYNHLARVVDANDNGASFNRAISRFRIATVHAAQRQWPAAAARFREAIELSGPAGEAPRGSVVNWAYNLAAAQARAGDPEGAEKTLQRVGTAPPGDDFDQAMRASQSAVVRTRQGRHAEAVELAERADAYFGAQPNRRLAARVKVLLGRSLLEAGRSGAALAPLREAEAQLTGGGGVDLAEAQLSLGQALLAAGQAADAKAVLEKAQATWTGAEPAALELWLTRGHMALALHRLGDRAAARPLAARVQSGLAGSNAHEAQALRTALQGLDP